MQARKTAQPVYLLTRSVNGWVIVAVKKNPAAERNERGRRNEVWLNCDAYQWCWARGAGRIDTEESRGDN